MDDRLVQRWRDAAAEAEVETAFRAAYAEIARETASQRPRCDKSGRCCRFDEFGHRLYVTGLETAAFLRQLKRPMSAADLARAERDGSCPFLVDGLCSVHDIRPMGCRVYFCDPTATEWQHEVYERSHQRIAALHEQHAVPYRYGEWRQMLRMCTTGATASERSESAVRTDTRLPSTSTAPVEAGMPTSAVSAHNSCTAPLPQLIHVRITC